MAELFVGLSVGGSLFLFFLFSSLSPPPPPLLFFRLLLDPRFSSTRVLPLRFGYHRHPLSLLSLPRDRTRLPIERTDMEDTPPFYETRGDEKLGGNLDFRPLRIFRGIVAKGSIGGGLDRCVATRGGSIRRRVSIFSQCPDIQGAK